MAAAGQMIRWIDTGTNARIVMVRLSGGGAKLAIYGLPERGFARESAIQSGFVPVARNPRMVFRNETRFTLSEMRKIFPYCRVAELPRSQVEVSVSDPRPEPVRDTEPVDGESTEKDSIQEENRELLIDVQGAMLLGVNYLGQEVFRDGTGERFAIGDGQRIPESRMSVNAAFLRAVSEEDMALCADGFVRVIFGGNSMNAQDLRRFGAVIFDDDSRMLSQHDVRLRKVQESVEAAIFRNFAKIGHGSWESAFSLAVGVEARQPSMVARTSSSVALQQYSTPLSLSVAIQHILSGVISDDAFVLEPAIGNASLVSMLPGKVSGYEVDPNRAAASRAFGEDRNFVVVDGDFFKAEIERKSFDVVIANPPFGGLAADAHVDGLRVSRIDHLMLMKSLQARKDEGASVYIIAGDKTGARGIPGEISGGSRYLFNWLCDHYEVSAFEVDGALYKKQGAGYPIRVVAIGRRVSGEESERRRKSEDSRIGSLEVISSHDDLWHFSSRLKSFVEANCDLSLASEDASFSSASQADKKFEQRLQNAFQTEYVPASSIGEASSMIPLNLAFSQEKAFDRLVAEIGDIDGFVAKKIGMAAGELGRRFTPEQVDALALAIWNIERGRGLILADETGQGKGRVMAGIAKYAARAGRDGIFLTQSSNLFSDLWRDVADIGGDDVVLPMVINNDTAIIDFETGNSIGKTAPAGARSRIFSGDASLFDEGYTTAFATYSQFNRPPSKMERSRWIAELQRGAIIMMDEAHRAAGDSISGWNISEAVNNAEGVVYSSATFAKDVNNFRVYSKAFPSSVNLDMLQETLRVGGEPLQEVLSAMLCEDGVLIRRESDVSKLTFEMVSPSNDVFLRNWDMAGRMSRILLAMSAFSEDIGDMARNVSKEMRKNIEKLSDQQKQGNRVGVSSVNFGSRLYNINRQFLLAMAVDTAVREGLHALENGMKPVFVIEQTMEAVLNEMGAEDDEDFQPIQFRDLLYRLLTKIQGVTIVDGYGEVRRESVFSLARTDEETTAIASVVNEINEMIADFPDMLASPIDTIRTELGKRGYRVGEISGRKRRVVESAGTYFVEDMPKVQRAKIVFDYNSGYYDGAVVTRAGCAGLSLHASEKFQDQRRRCLIEVQIPLNVDDRVQFFGRVNRRGQISVPRIVTATSGLPCETRLLTMQNAKLRKLSANTQSNRNSNMTKEEFPDILNAVGDAVCREYLLENPSVARRLGINLENEGVDSRGDGNYFVNRLTGRISLLPPEEQESVYADIFKAFDNRVAEMTAQGENPFTDNVIDVGATVVDSFLVFKGTGDSVFDAPVIAEKIEWEQDVDPIRGKTVVNAAMMFSRKLQDDRRYIENTSTYRGTIAFREEDGSQAIFKKVLLDSFLGLADEGFSSLMRKSVSKKFIDECDGDEDAAVRLALNDKDDNIVKAIRGRQDFLRKTLNAVTPMNVIDFTWQGEVVHGVVAAMNIPKPGKEHYLGEWEISVALPGAQKMIALSLNQLSRDSEFKSAPFAQFSFDGVRGALDAAPAGKVTFSRWTLSGNLFKSAEIAADNHLGMAGAYTDKDGLRRRAVICRYSVDREHIESCVIGISNPVDATAEIMRRIDSEPSGRIEFQRGYDLKWRDGRCEMFVPGGKATGGRIYLDEQVARSIGEFHGNRSAMSASFDVSHEKLLPLVSALYRYGMTVPMQREDMASEEEAGPRMVRAA